MSTIKLFIALALVGFISASSLNRTERSIGDEKCYQITTHHYKELVLNRFGKVQIKDDKRNDQYEFMVKPFSCSQDTAMTRSRCTDNIFAWEVVSPGYVDTKDMPETSKLYLQAPCVSWSGGRRNIGVRVLPSGGKVALQGIFVRKSSGDNSDTFRYQRYNTLNQAACYVEVHRTGRLKAYTTGYTPGVEFQGHPIESLPFDFRLQEVDCKMME